MLPTRTSFFVNPLSSLLMTAVEQSREFVIVLKSNHSAVGCGQNHPPKAPTSIDHRSLSKTFPPQSPVEGRLVPLFATFQTDPRVDAVLLCRRHA